MSTIRLKKEHPDYPGRKAGEPFSVPFVVGKQLVADGVADYPEAKPARKAPRVNRPARPQDNPSPTRGEPPTVRAEPEEEEDDDYESMTVEQLHKAAADRNLEGRSALTTKDSLVKALTKDDKAKGKK